MSTTNIGIRPSPFKMWSATGDKVASIHGRRVPAAVREIRIVADRAFGTGGRCQDVCWETQHGRYTFTLHEDSLQSDLDGLEVAMRLSLTC